MVKLPHPPLEDDDFEAPTAKRPVPAELRDYEGDAQTAGQVTTKLRRAEIDALLSKERQQKSGMRPAVTDEDIERFARREAVTLPAPPDTAPEEEPLPLGSVRTPPPPTVDEADLDAGDED